MAEGKQDGEGNGASGDDIGRNHGVVASVPLPAGEQKHGDSGTDEQADDGRRVPGVSLAALLHGKQQHEDRRDKDGAADQVQLLDALGHGFCLGVLGRSETEKDDGKGEGNDGDVDPGDVLVSCFRIVSFCNKQ